MNPFYRAFVGTAMTLCVAATPDSPSITFDRRDPSVVPKTVFSSNMRFAFSVGLEGTGHHYFVDVLDHLFQTNSHLVKVSEDDNVKRDAYGIDYSMAGTVLDYNAALISGRDVMRKLGQLGAELEFPGTVVSTPTRNSYPDGFGPNKALKYFDLRLLAEMAEEGGVDFRVVYLRRSVKDLIISDTVHQDLQSGLHNEGNPTPEQEYMQYMQVLLTDIAVMHSFLKELGPEFVVCHDYARLGDGDQAAAIADFIAPNADVAALLKQSFIEVAAGRVPSYESLLYEGAEVIAARLQRKFDAYEWEFCSGMGHD